MIWRHTARNPIATPLHQGDGHVGVRWCDVVVVGCFVSPNRTLAEDEDCLDGVRSAVNQHLSGPVPIIGDFNAHAIAWGCRCTNARGEELLEWAAVLNLRILNRCGAITCVMPAGESVVDVALASPAALKRLTPWGVEEKIELLRDHIPILMRYRSSRQARRLREEDRRGGIDSARRLQLQRVDGDAVHAADWSPAPAGDIDAQASELQRSMTEACDDAMPRATKLPPRSVYWWCVELTTLRERANRTRRRYTRARRGRAATSEKEFALRRECRRTNKSLRRAVKEARSSEWKALLETLHRDP
ncbi:uncharacterized protein LOC143220148 [Lasioglossum baleicum]|uniref:uncharacterized protein LOC143220148 n=1 Tax=Lasioglossum baleicum TaxID=434251 RepID=UPI003FCE317C